jgi:hypothetical protein
MSKEENALTTYGIAEITQREGMTVVERRGDVDLDDLSQQLMEIKDAINPVLAEEPQPGGFGLQQLVISLTVGAQGRILFIMSGSAEASITLTFSRPSTG